MLPKDVILDYKIAVDNIKLVPYNKIVKEEIT